jgi:hypothetical protein
MSTITAVAHQTLPITAEPPVLEITAFAEQSGACAIAVITTDLKVTRTEQSVPLFEEFRVGISNRYHADLQRRDTTQSRHCLGWRPDIVMALRADVALS